jgi:hypothetical protein
MNRSNLKAFTTAIANAGLSRKAALQYEVAVTFAVHLDSKGAKRLTRAVMCEIYAECGYKSSAPNDRDWREINRRITAGIALFDFMSQGESIADWVEGKARMEIVNAIVARLEPLDLRSTNQILEICDKVRTRAPKLPTPEPAGTHHIDLEHLKIVIPPAATRAELISAAIEMMRLAEERAKVEVQEAAVAAHETNGHTETVDEDETVDA